MRKISRVVRIPLELELRLNRYYEQLAKQEKNIKKTDAMRRFAEEAIVPEDDVKKLFEVLSKKQFKI